MLSILAAMAFSVVVAPPSANAVYGGTSFLEVSQSGQVREWIRSGNTYARSIVWFGWGHARLVTGLGAKSELLMTNNNELHYCPPSSACQFVSGNWQARLITGLNPTIFLEVTHGGDLIRWGRQPNGTWAPLRVGTGWQTARLIAGLDSDNFVEVKFDGRLAKWTWNGSAWNQRIIGPGWETARLIAGVNSNRFVQVHTDGTLWEWNASGNTYVRTQVGQGWGPENAKVIG